jgi:hypothetical protein
LSRDTDSSSAGSQGRGGPAYPSGTPPYGTRPFPSLHPQERSRPANAPGAVPEPPEQPDEPAADEPRTETTLTTRIRINIPGSRPIPPVVVRTTVDDSAPTAPPAAEPAQDPAGSASASAAPAEPEPGPEKTSDWFAPRKPANTPPPAPPSGLGGPGGTAGGSAGAGSFGGQGVPYGAGSGADAFSGAAGMPAADPYGERRTADPYPDYDTGSHPIPPPAPPADLYPDYDTGSRPIPQVAPPVDPNATSGGFRAGARGPHDTPAAGFASPFAPGTESFPPGVPRPTDPFPGGADPYAAAGPPAPATEGPFPGYQPPAGPTTGPATGTMPVPPAGPTRPRPSVPQPGSGPPSEERGSSDTVVSGIPTVPSSGSRAPRRAAPVPGPAPAAATVPAPAPAASAPAPSSAAAKPKKKRRSKLVLLAVAACGCVVLAYGAGLLMNHADVPQGTTVLGVDIGNKSVMQAGKILDQELGNRTTAPLTLTIGGKSQTLKPSIAGLSFDTDATIRKVAHTEYNPVSVLGSLFGGTHPADPVILVDEDKLKAALTAVAGRNSTASDGMIRFEPNKVVPVAGKVGSSFDVNAAANQVAAAYRVRAQTGSDTPIDLAVTTVQPKVTQAELDTAANGFAKRAMSHVTTVRAKTGHSIKIGPTVSLPKILTMVPDAAGHLQPHIDLAALKTLYGTAFDGILLKRADGSKSAVTPQDVAAALLPGLDATGDKTVTLPGVV